MVDVIVVGSGPNGLAAAVTMARAGLSVRLLERMDGLGGGMRTAEATLPGFRHDICSAVHPMALASPFFRDFELARRIDLRLPEASYGHPLDGGTVGMAWRDLERTATDLGIDGKAWRDYFQPLVRHISAVRDVSTSPLLRLPSHPLMMPMMGLRALEQGTPAWNVRFDGEVAPAMFTGVAAHSIGKHPDFASASIGLVLAAHAHAAGWPVPIGGSQAIADALADDLRAHGGTIETGVDVRRLEDVRDAKAVLLDVSVPSLLAIGEGMLPDRYAARLRRFRPGQAVCKVDFALSAPVPWTNPELARTATIHLGGTRAEIAAAENDVMRGRHPERPYVLVTQPSLFDDSRAPAGKHVLWAYTHVPNGSTEDRTDAIVRQLERYAPGFRETVLASASRTAAELAVYNPNYPGGDISGGALAFWQLVGRPVLSPTPWRTPVKGIYLCSGSTPPGPSVHGMCGWYAARTALRDVFGIRAMPNLGLDG